MRLEHRGPLSLTSVDRGPSQPSDLLPNCLNACTPILFEISAMKNWKVINTISILIKFQLLHSGRIGSIEFLASNIMSRKGLTVEPWPAMALAPRSCNVQKVTLVGQRISYRHVPPSTYLVTSKYLMLDPIHTSRNFEFQQMRHLCPWRKGACKRFIWHHRTSGLLSCPDILLQFLKHLTSQSSLAWTFVGYSVSSVGKLWQQTWLAG